MDRSTSVLDNVVWGSITGPHRHLAEVREKAGRFNRDVAPFAGLSDFDAASWDELGSLIGAGKATVLFGPRIEVPEGWSTELRFECLQLVADRVSDSGREADLVDLGPSDVDEMLALVSATQPGPFGPRTIELGTYLGHKVDGRLVAMAGERMSCEGHVEVSAVCTAAEHRGKGLGGALTLAVVDRLRARGREAFLHVKNDNTPALRLYLALGFTVRREMDVVIARRTA